MHHVLLRCMCVLRHIRFQVPRGKEILQSIIIILWVAMKFAFSATGLIAPSILEFSLPSITLDLLSPHIHTVQGLKTRLILPIFAPSPLYSQFPPPHSQSPFCSFFCHSRRRFFLFAQSIFFLGRFGVMIKNRHYSLPPPSLPLSLSLTIPPPTALSSAKCSDLI